MDRVYKLTAVERRDEWISNYSQNGQPDMVDYAIAVEGEQGWIKLSQKVATKPPVVGGELFGHVEEKTNSKGNAYRKFKKATQQQGGGNLGGQNEKVDYIVTMLEELTGRRQKVDTVAPVTDDVLEDPFAGLGI